MENLANNVLLVLKPMVTSLSLPWKHRSGFLSEIFFNEIDAWARQALAANGFGDY